MKKIAVALLSAVAFSSSFANVDKGLAYKSSGLSADDVAAQNYFVNHFFAFDNYGIGKSGNDITAMILRPKDSNPFTPASFGLLFKYLSRVRVRGFESLGLRIMEVISLPLLPIP